MNVLVVGSCGTMGSLLTQKLEGMTDITVCGYDRQSCHPKTFTSFDNLSMLDVMVDFSHPSSLEGLLAYATSKSIPLVLATTGYTEGQIASIKEASKVIPIFYSANYSMGIEILKKAISLVAKSIGQQSDIEIIDVHHHLKKDAPSGTALALAASVNDALETPKQITTHRDGLRVHDELMIHSLRGGTVVGDHTVSFFMDQEVIELKHQAQSKLIFINGALRAMMFIVNQSPGFYEMKHLMEENI